MKNKIRIAYIAALGHSGSTILDILLGTNPMLVGLGEVSAILDTNSEWLERKENFCSCGKPIYKCIFWSKVIPRIREANKANKSYQEKYLIVVNEFKKIFGENALIVDSSKQKKYLDQISKIAEIDLKVIHLIRDVRPWTVSHINKIKKAKSEQIKKPWKNGLQGMVLTQLYNLPIFLFWLWYISILRTKRLMARRGVANFQVGYEEIAFYADTVLPQLCRFLGVEYTKQMLEIRKTKSHVAAGNRMRLQENKRRKFLYDNRWFYQNDWLLPSIIFPNIIQFNHKEVYRHTKQSIWNT